MKVYSASLIDKSLRADNAILRKKLTKDYRKTLRIPKSAVNSDELNAFVILSGELNGKGMIDQKLIDKIEQGRLYTRLKKYYHSNESKLQRSLKKKQELRETSQIVKNFIKEIDPNLTKVFDTQLKQISTDLPIKYCEIYVKSYVTLWDFVESQEYRFFLSGFDFPVFSGTTIENHMNISELVDKILIVNFFASFLKPTLIRLREMDSVLDRLILGLTGTHYKSTNPKLQAKLNMFFRILAAKLSALQDVDRLISRIFDLFEVPRVLLNQYNFKSDFMDFNSALADIATEIDTGKALLNEVRIKLQKCQMSLRDYLDERINGIKTTDSIEEFQHGLLPFAELSINLFVEAELLKMWSDFFGTDLPYFSFNTKLFDSQSHETQDVADDTIIRVHGLFKNYNLGRTTVYAIRGINLDIKEGEFVAIMGPSGCGKTTLLNCMAGLDSPDNGTILFRGENLHTMNDSAKSTIRLHEMGFIFQSYALLPHFDARENVALPADLAGLSKDLRSRIEDLLDGVGIAQQAEQFPAQLSGGQMQRVAIARALTNHPTVIFADEPTGDLDSVTGKQVMNLLKKFHDETKTTIIVITHEADIAAYADRQVLMEDGIITQS